MNISQLSALIMLPLTSSPEKSAFEMFLFVLLSIGMLTQVPFLKL